MSVTMISFPARPNTWFGLRPRLQAWLARRNAAQMHRRMAALDASVLEDIGVEAHSLVERRRKHRPMDPVLFTSLAESAAASATLDSVRSQMADGFTHHR